MRGVSITHEGWVLRSATMAVPEVLKPALKSISYWVFKKQKTKKRLFNFLAFVEKNASFTTAFTEEQGHN